MKKPKTVLIVEDEKALREALADTLKREGLRTLEARNGREGVEMALAHHPDMILLDVIMPELDGITALKKIREDTWGTKEPVIMLTNKNATDASLVEDIVKSRPELYLIKSDWKIYDLVKKIKEILSNQ